VAPYCCVSITASPWWCFQPRYDDNLKEARALGAKKGVAVGFSLFLIFFLIFLVDTVGFW